MMQTVLVVLLFLLALFFLGRKLYIEFVGKGDHCGDCVASDIREKSRAER